MHSWPACLRIAHAAEASNGGASPDDPRYAPAKKAKIVNGYAIRRRNAPRRVKRAIDAANEIVDKPYKYGGGHARSRTAATTARAPSRTP